MSGYNTYTRWQRIEAQARALGFRIGNPQHGWRGEDTVDMVALYPAEDALPVYTRDAELFVGTFSGIETWLSGWARAQQYDQLLRISDAKKRKQYEAKEVERQRIIREKAEQRKTFAILADKTEAEVEKLERKGKRK